MEIYLYKDEGVLVVLEGPKLVKKTVYGLNHSGLRSRVSPDEMVDREIRALEALKEVSDVQKFVSRISPQSFCSQYMEGVHLSAYGGRLPTESFDRLDDIVAECQGLGVYRLDRFLRAERDIIVRPDLTLGITDFGDVLFPDDPRARIPGVLGLVKMFNQVQLYHLRRRYGHQIHESLQFNNSEAN